MNLSHDQLRRCILDVFRRQGATQDANLMMEIPQAAIDLGFAQVSPPGISPQDLSVALNMSCRFGIG
jgi:hypothetical protein